MRRYMICRALPGVPNSPPPTLGNHAELAELSTGNQNYTALVPTKPNGSLKYNFAMCAVSAINWSPVYTLTNSYVFPDYNLDGLMSGMDSAARTGMVADVQAYDLDGNGLHLDATHSDGDSYRDVLVKIAKQFEPAINTLETQFSTPEASP